MTRRWWHVFFFARLLSPGGLLLRAAAIVLIFLVLHALGLREYATVVTGTSPTGGPLTAATVALAVAYVSAHLGTVAVAPVLALAAMLWGGWLYFGSRQTVKNGE